MEGRGSFIALALFARLVCVVGWCAFDSKHNLVASMAGAGTVACPHGGSCPLLRRCEGGKKPVCYFTAWPTGRCHCVCSKGGRVCHSPSVCLAVRSSQCCCAAAQLVVLSVAHKALEGQVAARCSAGQFRRVEGSCEGSEANSIIRGWSGTCLCESRAVA